jgi:hypothetical protein
MKKLIALMMFLVFSGSVVPLMGQSDSDEETTTTESTGGVYPSEAQGPDTNVISPKPQVSPVPKLQAPEFTRELRVAAQTQNEIRPNYYLLEGYVDLVHEGVRLQADRAEYDANTKELIAIGNVVLDQENQHLTGEKLEMNLETRRHHV